MQTLSPEGSDQQVLPALFVHVPHLVSMAHRFMWLQGALLNAKVLAMNAPTYATMLERFCRLATTAEKQALADACDTTYDYAVFHLAKGRREPDALLAAKIEAATKLLSRQSGGRLPIVYRTEMNSACRACVFAQRCLGDAAIASEFPLVG